MLRKFQENSFSGIKLLIQSFPIVRIDTNTRYISNFLHFKNNTLLEKFQEKSNVFKNTVSLTRHENPQESVRGAIASRPVTEDENNFGIE